MTYYGKPPWWKTIRGQLSILVVLGAVALITCKLGGVLDYIIYG